MAKASRFALVVVFMLFIMAKCDGNKCVDGHCPEPTTPQVLRFRDLPTAPDGEFVLLGTRLQDPIAITSSEMTISLPIGSNILAVQNTKTLNTISVSFANATAGSNQAIEIGGRGTLTYLIFRSIGVLPFEKNSFESVAKWIEEDPQRVALAEAVASGSKAGGVAGVLTRSDITMQLQQTLQQAASSFACDPTPDQTGSTRLRPFLEIGTLAPSCSDSTRVITFKNGYERYITARLQQSNGVTIPLNGNQAFTGYLVDPVVGIPTDASDVVDKLISYVHGVASVVCGSKAVDVLTELTSKSSNATFTLPSNQQTVQLLLTDDFYSLTATVIFLTARSLPIKPESAREIVRAVYDIYSENWKILEAARIFVKVPTANNFKSILDEAVPMVWEIAKNRGLLGGKAEQVLDIIEHKLQVVRFTQGILAGFSAWLENRPLEVISLNVGAAYLPNCCGRQNQVCCNSSPACLDGLTCQADLCTTPLSSPTVSVRPGSGPKGTIFQEPGYGFTRGGSITQHFQKPSGIETTGVKTADASGAFSHIYDSSMVDEYGTFKYWAVDNTTGKTSNVATFQITPAVNPLVTVSPGSGPKGTIFQEPGYGFTPGGSITQHFQKPSGIETTGVKTADASGAFSHVYDSSMVDEYGTFKYWAVDNTTGKTSNLATFQITR